MPLSTLTITLTNNRLIDGWVAAANANGYTPDALALEFLETQGRSYADLNRVGVITSAAFMARFTPAEYTEIMTAAQQSPEIAALVDQLTAAPNVVLDDPRLEPGLQQLATAGLITADRIPELLAYTRPEPAEQVGERARNELGQFIADDPTTPDVDEAWVPTP